MRAVALCAVIILSLIFENSAYAMPSGVHGFIAYEASLLPGVPSEIGAYAGDPENCLTQFMDTLCQGAYDEDNDRDPRSDHANIFSWFGLLNWGSHFWNPEGGPTGGRLDYAGEIPVNLEEKNAYQRASELYAQAKMLYNENPGAAYYRLGKAAHLIADMATPAHVHLDVHISDETQFGDDSVEEYLEARYGESASGRLVFESDFPIWALLPVDYVNLPDGGYADEPLLYRIFLSMANIAKGYDSDDADGRFDNGSRRGMSAPVSQTILDTLLTVWILRSGYPDEVLSQGYRISSARGKFILLNSTFEALKSADPPYEAIRLDFAGGSETHDLSEFTITDMGDYDTAELASALIPAAIEHTAALYQLFWAETHSSLSGAIPAIALNNGVHGSRITRPEPIEIEIDIDPGDWAGAEVEIYAWLDASLAGEKVKMYFDSAWAPFDQYGDMRPVLYSWALADVHDVIWRILDDTSMLPDLDFAINLCIDRANDGYYSPGESVCDGTWITLGGDGK